jgi:tetratricopeptide (TPR) repeat protein
MTVKNTFDLSAKISAYPIVEVAAEIRNAGLSGALRVESGEQKAVVYFNAGNVVYAVSNQRVFRLSEVLLGMGLIDMSFLVTNRDISSDLQLREKIVETGRMTAEEVNSVISSLCESIVAAHLQWSEGDWAFSPHSRAKADLAFNVDLGHLILDHSRTIRAETVVRRLSNPNEWFESTGSAAEVLLDPQEAFIMSRLQNVPITLDQLISLSGLERDAAIGVIYSLWTIGSLRRHGRTPVFSERYLDAMKAAILEPKRLKPTLAAPATPLAQPVVNVAIEEDGLPLNEEFDLESTLKRIESAQNFYQIFNIDTSAKVTTIRKSYFRLAKMLHPDRYRGESSDLLTRIEKAFTDLSQAHETLKGTESRQGYDIKMRQAERDRSRLNPSGKELTKQEEQAAVDFERGFALQLEGEFEAAVPYLARAAHYAPDNARYHAYYGKALAADESQRHKAEKELVTAIRLDPSNSAIKLLFAEFLIRNNLIKRAEGELQRLLKASPDSREAQVLLDSVRAKSLN